MLNVQSFNHVSRQVLSLDATRDFYVKLLGFKEIPRPDLPSVGAWLCGHGVILHLIQEECVVNRGEVSMENIGRAMGKIPLVDHIAFLCFDLENAEATLKKLHIPFRKNLAKFGATQLFAVDPDGHVVEISDCAPPPGFVLCQGSTSNSSEEDANKPATHARDGRN